MKIKQSDSPFKLIDYILFNESEIRQAIFEARTNHKAPEIANHNALSDPTAQEAVKNLTPVRGVTVNGKVLSAPELWLDVAEKTRNWCTRRGGRFPEVFNRYYGGEHFVQSCLELGFSVNRFYRTLDKIRNHATLWAVWHHLIELE